MVFRSSRIIRVAAVTAVAVTSLQIPDAQGVAGIPTAGNVDYQLGGAYTPPTGVTVVARDRTASIASGRYNICYINAFQTQPDEKAWWRSNHPDLVLTKNGSWLGDPNWPGEYYLDISTADKRTRLAAIMKSWMQGCKNKGFVAVEGDNLDSYTRANYKITESNAIAFAKLFTAAAHGLGLAVGQKNAAEIAPKGREMGFDFAVAEECSRYNECSQYTNEYGTNQVIMIEYRRTDFDKGCSKYSSAKIVYRDINLVPAGRTGYRYDAC
jgi:Glycoside-hydrolase family GH114